MTEALWFYAGMSLVTAFWMLAGAKPGTRGEWLAFAGIVAVWPAFVVYAIFRGQE
jgi:hypothetical protein